MSSASMAQDPQTTRRVNVRAIAEGQADVLGERRLICEAPLGIDVDGADPLTIMRTPGNDRELTVGFLFTEGAIRNVGDILMLAECPDSADLIRVKLAQGANAACLRRATASVSSCGWCGRESVEQTVARLKPLPDGPPVPRELLCRMPDAMRDGQVWHQATGACHAAAAFDLSGQLIQVREDVGRHNALDKLIGWSLLSSQSLADAALMLSGRASLEMVIKAAAAGVRVVASVSAPTSLGVEVAERLNMTLCGFCRGPKGTIYAHPERLAG